jgi:hypothetical protein
MLMGSTGRRRMGKTTLVVHVADKVERRLMLDPRQMIRRPGAVVVRSASALQRVMPQLADGDFIEVVYSPLEDLPQAFDAFALELRRWVTERPDLELATVIDEASFFGALEEREAFMFAVKCCDPERFHPLLTCHRPSDLHPDIRALLNRWCIFRTTQEHDLDVIRKRCKAEVVDLVQQLDDRQFVEWNDDDGTYEVHRYPFIWQTDLSLPGADRSILFLQ